MRIRRSEFVRSGDEQRVTRIRGSLEDLALLERSLVQYEVDVVFHLGAQTQVRHAQRQPWATMEANVRGTYNLLEAVHRVGPQVRALVVASSDKAYGESLTLPYTEMHPLAGPEHLRRFEERRRPADLGLRREFRPPGRDRPLRQHLWGRRPQLGSHRSGHDPIAPAWRGADHPKRRDAPARLPAC